MGSATPAVPGPAIRATLADGREHWQHGPIDLIIATWGDTASIDRAKSLAWQRFSGILLELVSELPALRSPLNRDNSAPVERFRGGVAQRMLAACRPFAAQFITPMAAVAGSVADEVMTFFAAEPGIAKAYVNNGGDIAVHVAPGESLNIGIAAPKIGTVPVDFSSLWRGIATSGWRGRSFSLGIADAVTVLARTAAQADAAATMIGNAVNLDHPAIRRAPADSLKDDTDLGALLVTTEVDALPGDAVRRALMEGLVFAEECIARGLIAGAVVQLQGQWHTTRGGLLAGLPQQQS